MSRFRVIIGYIKPYWFFALLNIVFNVLSAFFALFSFVMAIPFLRILFKTQELIYASVPFEFSMEAIQHNFNYFLSRVVTENGDGPALMIVSIMVVIMALLKTGFKFLANYFITPVRVGTIKRYPQ